LREIRVFCQNISPNGFLASDDLVAAHLSLNGGKDGFGLLKCESLQLGNYSNINIDLVTCASETIGEGTSLSS
jgi:hypothetical protein